MLDIWGRISSINVRKVVWCAQELGLAFRRHDIGGRFGAVDPALNPNALIPVIEEPAEDGPLRLWESNVIVRYLCARHAPGTLYPEGLRERFEAERWMDWQQTTLNRASGGAFLQWIRTPAERRDAALIAQSVAATEPLLAQLDAHLAGRDFLVAGRFTMADVPIGCELHRWFGIPGGDAARAAHPNLDRYFTALRARPGARGVLDLALE